MNAQRPSQASPWLLCFLNAWLVLPVVGAQAPANVDLTFPAELAKIRADDAQVRRGANGALIIETGYKTKYPGITLKAPADHWNLSAYRYFALLVRNTGPAPVTVRCRVDNPGANGQKNCVNGDLTLDPGEQNTLFVNLSASSWRLSQNLDLIGMRGAPGRLKDFDPANVTQYVVFVASPETNYVFEIRDAHAEGKLTELDAQKFLPFIDEFGQFIHADWPGKIHSLQEFSLALQSEKNDIAANPGPPERDSYGGWAAGPQLEATGFFRVQKHEGKWWLVDPAGKLFWSHGADCVRLSSHTPISDREAYFRPLPPPGAPLAAFYGKGSGAAHGYYEKNWNYRTYDFIGANLLRKYGASYTNVLPPLLHQRLRSWGLNTIANWSDPRIYELRRTPYTATLSLHSKPIAGSQGYWGKFADVFDDSFRASVRKGMEKEMSHSVGDPWCIGYYVDNELGWGSDTSLALGALTSPSNQPAKKVLLADLQKKYETVETLNAAWQTQYASWDALSASTNAPDLKKATNAVEDLHAFYTKLAETYFEIIRDELKKAAPHQLYLGCRFAWVNDLAARAAAKYCDVVSYNRYEYSVANLKLPDDLDRPLIIGEFHFGALDRGMFHTGLRKAASQEDRAQKYQAYVLGALANPRLIGTHWFQFYDQPTTGRSDGENYQIGFLDTCDTPYAELIQASRDVAQRLYPYRATGK